MIFRTTFSAGRGSVAGAGLTISRGADGQRLDD
jgi:hypothetical protein